MALDLSFQIRTANRPFYLPPLMSSDASLVESPDFKTCSRPVRSYTLANNAYALSLASLPGCYAASASAPSNVIDLLDKTTLRRIQSLPGHEVATTTLKTVQTIAGHVGPSLVSSGRDGSVKVWDGRSNDHSIKMTNPARNRPLLCCDVSSDGMTVAAGSDLQGQDALIVFWDPRQPAAPLRVHSAAHSDDVTNVQFRANNLLSGSSDGLLCISNAFENDEDEAVLHVGSWGCSVSQLGWIHDTNIWAGSDMETFSIWSNELDMLHNLDIRSPSLYSQSLTWVTDYLISCRTTDGDLGIFVGSNEGDVALLSNTNLSASGSTWTLHNTWTNGHTEVVRAALWDTEHNILVTGGEDSKINMWDMGHLWPAMQL